MSEIRRRVKPGDVCYFTVAGTGEFPLDMLRYDSCWPARSEDALAIGDSSYAKAEGRDLSKVWQIVLACKPGDNWSSVPTHGRWKSFTWTASGLRSSIEAY